MTEPQQIYIIRHGETDFNRKQIIQGRGVNSSLNDTGRQQASSFYQKYRQVPFGQLYCSALERSFQTIEPFLRHDYPLQRLEDLDEIHWGIHEGKPADAKLHKEYMSITSAWSAGKLHMRAEGAESANDLVIRLRRFRMILERQDAKHILICTHGRTLRALVCILLGEPPMNMENYMHNNTGLYHFEKTGNRFALLKMNDLSHLQEKSHNG